MTDKPVFDASDQIILAKAVDLYRGWVREQAWRVSEKAVTLTHVSELEVKLGLAAKCSSCGHIGDPLDVGDVNCAQCAEGFDGKVVAGGK